MLYYLLNKRYFLSDPWLENIPFPKAKSELENKIKNNIFPKACIFAVGSARNSVWPGTQIDLAEDDYYLRFVKNNNYYFYYNNDYFRVYYQERKK